MYFVPIRSQVVGINPYIRLCTSTVPDTANERETFFEQYMEVGKTGLLVDIFDIAVRLLGVMATFLVEEIFY